MADPTKRPGDIPQREDDAAPSEPTRVGRDDAPSPQQQAEDVPKPPPRRDNQAEAITGAPTL